MSKNEVLGRSRGEFYNKLNPYNHISKGKENEIEYNSTMLHRVSVKIRGRNN